MKDAFNQTHSFIAAFVLVALVGAAVILTFKAAPDGSRDIVAMIIGALVAALGQIMKHYFDGSKREERRERQVEVERERQESDTTENRKGTKP